ncbi:hypothetical protein RB195_001333 [Necator americanus]|uniref:Uncharacterized protein n=1 Tax=Necator americanus TaxID=51031 RepID=A0ABR1DFD3_NECAM
MLQNYSVPPTPHHVRPCNGNGVLLTTDSEDHYHWMLTTLLQTTVTNSLGRAAGPFYADDTNLREDMCPPP